MAPVQFLADLLSPPLLSAVRPLSASPKSGKTSPSSDPAQETGVPDLGKQEPLRPLDADLGFENKYKAIAVSMDLLISCTQLLMQTFK